MLGGTHVGTVGQHLYRHTDRQLFRHLLLGQLPALIMARSLGQQQRQAVLSLIYLRLKVEHGRLHAVISRLHLRHGRLVIQARIHQSLGRIHGLAPCLGRLPRDFELGVQHQQRIIGIRNSCYQLRPHRLPVVLALGVQGLGLLLRIAHPAEDVNLPAGRHRSLPGPAGLRLALPSADASLRRERERGQERQPRGLERSLSLLHAILRGHIIRIVRKTAFDQRLQAAVGEDLLPFEIAEIRGVLHFHGHAVEILGHRFRRLVASVDAACTGQQRERGEHQYLVYIPYHIIQV